MDLDSGTDIVVPAETTVSGIDASLWSPARITGTISGEGFPMEQARVVARNLTHGQTFRATTDEMGAFAVTNLPPGEYRIKAGAYGFQDEWWEGANHEDQADVVDLAQGEEAVFDFDLAAGRSPAFVEVTSEPTGAEIFVDYHPTGEVTPAMIPLGQFMPVASHTVALTVRLQNHAIPSVQRTEVAEAETHRVHFDIDALPSQQTGSVSISTDPEIHAEVYVNYCDMPTGQTPLVIENLMPGEHTLILHGPGYLQPAPIVFTIVMGVTTVIAVPVHELESESPRESVLVASDPDGAEIYIDYLPTGQVTNVRIEGLDAGRYEGTHWRSASHTVMLRRSGSLRTTAYFLSDLDEEDRVDFNWMGAPYTLAFDSAGGSAVEPITQDYGTAVTPPPAPTRVGHTFVGWDPAVPETMPTEDLALTAQWTVMQYTLRYTAETGGRIEGDETQIVSHGEDGARVQAVAERGHRFDRWSDGLETADRQDQNVIGGLSVTAEFQPERSVRLDFDGDGISDLGVYHPPSGNWYIFGSGEGFWQTQFGFEGTVPIVGDFDGDGIDDFGVYYPPTGMWYLFMSTDGFREIQFGFDGTIPIVGDFDGDGVDDFGCYHPPTGMWYVFTSTDGFRQVQFGYTGTLPVVGDFDGDGIDDFGCYHPPSGSWYVFRSTDGFWQTQFGYAGTIPVVGDFDGDGRADIGVYYPPGGNWYIFGTERGFFTEQFGYAGTLPLGAPAGGY